MSFYVEFIETGSLAAYMRIIALRRDKTAQREIQDFAIAIDSFISQHFPQCWSAMEEIKKS
jgi:thymidylate synthase ThyX